ncbi:hypothetical protein UK12_20170 [Saccharothrix sp. ST-888]|nr:hypothetical protein UK12_20170 [Saccharothrix sp. ST-888]
MADEAYSSGSSSASPSTEDTPGTGSVGTSVPVSGLAGDTDAEDGAVDVVAGVDAGAAVSAVGAEAGAAVVTGTGAFGVFGAFGLFAAALAEVAGATAAPLGEEADGEAGAGRGTLMDSSSSSRTVSGRNPALGRPEPVVTCVPSSSCDPSSHPPGAAGRRPTHGCWPATRGRGTTDVIL